MIRILLGALVLLIASCGWAAAAPSSFQRSCKNIEVVAKKNGAFIMAQCGDGDGGWNNTSLPIRGIHNIFGQLTRDGKAESSFQRSCPDIWLEVNKARVLLWANCGDGDGGMQETSIELTNIENIFGQLAYAGGNKPVPRKDKNKIVIVERISGFNLTVARFDQGRYKDLGGGRWAELGDNGSRFNFVETDRDAQTVYLLDRSRNVRIALDTRSRMILYASGREKLRPLYKIIDMK